MNRETIYWIIVLLTFLYFIYKNVKNSFFILIILFFYEGLFTYFGKITWNSYKIFLPIMAIYLVAKNQEFIRINPKERVVIIAFSVFSLAFSFSSFINEDPLLLFLNQYSRYLLPFISLFLVKSYIRNRAGYYYLNNLIISLIGVQIILTVINFLLMGVHESIVGSLSSNGGAAATIFPALAFIFIWLKKKGNLDRSDWGYFVLLLFIGFVSNKRAIWIIAPLIALLLLFYVNPVRARFNILISVIFFIGIFYLGVRLNPTLNKEGKTWGSFDFDYFYNYSKDYTFGDENDDEIIEGRGGATLLTMKNIFNFEQTKSIMGNGLEKIYAWTESTSEDSNAPVKISNINSVTMATGLFQNYYTGGIIGVISFLAFMYSLFSLIYYNKFRFLLLMLFLWEYLLYANTIIRLPVLSFLFIYLILFSNYQFYKNFSLPDGNKKVAVGIS